MSDDDGIPWLTTPQRDFLAHLTVITIQPQLKPARSYERISDALGELADAGEVVLRADDDNVWVFICGRVIVHAARDWLEWATARERTARATSPLGDASSHVVSCACRLPRWRSSR